MQGKRGGQALLSRRRIDLALRPICQDSSKVAKQAVSLLHKRSKLVRTPSATILSILDWVALVVIKPKIATTNKAQGMGLTVVELHLAATAAMAAEGAGMATTVVATRSSTTTFN